MFKNVVYASGMVGKIKAIEGLLCFVKDDGMIFRLAHSDPSITLLDSLGFYYDPKIEDFIITELLNEQEIDLKQYIKMSPEKIGCFLPSIDENVQENYISFTISVLTMYDDNKTNRIYIVKIPEIRVMLGPDRDIVCWIYEEKKGQVVGKIDHSPSTLGKTTKIEGSWEKLWGQ